MRTKWTAIEWVSRSLAVAAVGLIPWMVLLSRTLPDETQVQNWNRAWVGLDVLLAAGCLVTALLAQRGDERVRVAAAATGAVALLDAWFDITTSVSMAAFAQAVACAVGELLLTVACCYLALRPRE
ncbi:hypothetical protein AB0N05_30070 [Nocardia sp. NPDC051030]|uniref:hypothetical protein n=1 Tax=Nocardia sp. NPDC051030 TaxID=3155162 RepID=UPI0034371363